MSKFLTKENIIIAVVVFAMIVQSNYFATKLDLANLKLEISEIKNDIKDYSDRQDKEILHEIDGKIQIISQKLDKIK